MKEAINLLISKLVTLWTLKKFSFAVAISLVMLATQILVYFKYFYAVFFLILIIKIRSHNVKLFQENIDKNICIDI